MNAPEKLYLSKNIYSTFVYQTPNPEDETEVEYTQVDAFIERACEFLFENYHGEKLSLRMIENFRRYLKGEKRLKEVAKCVIDEGKTEMDYCFTKMMNGEKVSPAWSEEDERLYNSALWHVKNSCGNGGKTSGEYEVYNWLKSLKERYTWKPSKEHMKALHDLNLTGNISYAGQGQVLIELYNDLKKL